MRHPANGQDYRPFSTKPSPRRDALADWPGPWRLVVTKDGATQGVCDFDSRESEVAVAMAATYKSEGYRVEFEPVRRRVFL